ncbi:MAG: Hpt domain-containing protein [bacterium]
MGQGGAAGPVVFDREDLLERLMGDEELASDIMNLTLENVPTQLAELKDAIKQGDLDSIRSLSHNLKGGAGNVGAKAMQAVAFDMEQAGKADDIARAEALMPKLEETFNLLRDELQRQGLIESVEVERNV